MLLQDAVQAGEDLGALRGDEVEPLLEVGVVLDDVVDLKRLAVVLEVPDLGLDSLHAGLEIVQAGLDLLGHLASLS